MGGIFTKEERAVVVFLTVALAVGSAVLAVRRVEPRFGPSLGPDTAAPGVRGEEPAKGVVDVNRAELEELVGLPGIGPVRAREILRLREERGGFASLEELLDVKGIGPATLERLRPAARVGKPTEADTVHAQGRRA